MRDPPDDYDFGDEQMLLTDQSLESAIAAMDNALARLDYVAGLVPEPLDYDDVDLDNWLPRGRIDAANHDVRRFRECLAEERARRMRDER